MYYTFDANFFQKKNARLNAFIVLSVGIAALQHKNMLEKALQNKILALLNRI